MFSLEKRRLRGDLITMFQYLKGSYKEDGDFLFTRNNMEKMRGNGYMLLLGIFRLDTRGKFFTMRTISHWNNGWGSGGFPNTGHFYVSAILSRPGFCQERLNQMILEVPSHLVFSDSVIL